MTANFDPDWHYAVVVGINTYPALNDLHLARADALAFNDWLLESGVPEKNIKLITAKPDAKFPTADDAIPTRQLIDSALRDLIATVTKRRLAEPQNWLCSRLYLYLSGHGVTPSAKEAALLMANAQQDVFGDSLACSLYLEYFEDAGHFHELVFLADCCRTFSMQTQPLGPPFNRQLNIVGPVSSVVGFATAFGELAYEPAASPAGVAPIEADAFRGHFTRALLEGLRGKAVDRSTQQINSTSLAKYVRDRVIALTATIPRARQVPQIKAEPAMPIVFVPNAPIPDWPVTIRFPVGFLGTVVLRNDDGEIERYDASSGDWLKPLQTGLYEVVTDAADQFANSGLFRVRGEPLVVQL